MRWIFVCNVGDLLPIAYEFQENGHEVVVVLWKNKSAVKQKVYRGLIKNMMLGFPRLDNRNDIIVFENASLPDLAERFLKERFFVIGGHPQMQKFETKRWETIELMRKLSIAVPETVYVKSESDISRVQRIFAKKKCVLKEERIGATSNTIICRDGEMLGEIIKEKLKENTLSLPVIVQEFIEGIEISTEAWFSHGQFVPPLNSTFEDKKFLAGDIGPNTGCMSSTIFNWKDTFNCRPFRQIFKFIIQILKPLDYTGPFDINSIISFKDHRMYFLEVTPRFGYNAIYAWKHLLNVPLWEVFIKLLANEYTELPVKYDEFSFALRLSIPPYPNAPYDYNENDQLVNVVEGKPIEIPLALSKNLYLLDVRRKNNGKLEMAGDDGIVGELVDTGKTIQEARTKVFTIVKWLNIPDLQYRIDAGERAEKAYNILKEWRWIE